MKNVKIILFLLGIALVAGFIFYFKSGLPNTSGSSPAQSVKLKIVTSFYPLYFFASEIGKEKAQVTNITPAGVEPHDYEPTAYDLAQITTSTMLILNGGSFETWGNKIKDQLGSNVFVVTAGEGLLGKEGETIQDPHVWLDPVLAKKEVENIGKSFEKIDPQNALYFQANAKTLLDKLDGLDADFKKGLAHCQKKEFITSHQSFGYLAARYGINQIAISGLSPSEEPSTKKLAEIADQVKKQGISVIFFENLVSPKLSQTLASETGARTMVLDPLEGVNDDSIKEGRDYFKIMRENLTNLQIALQCNQ